MQYTFNNVDPSKKNKRTNWIDKLEPQKQTQFQKFTSTKEKNYQLKQPSTSTVETLKDPIREIMKQEINKRLRNTTHTFDSLEEKFFKNENLHILYDVTGNSIWFCGNYMKELKRTEAEYFSVNCFQILGNEMNNGHPLYDIFKQNFDVKPKEFVFQSSPVYSGKGVKIAFKAKFERVDDLNGNVFGFFLHISPNRDFPL
eukprot:gene8056-12518_t